MAVVVGLHAFGHEAGAAIVTPDGVWALSEERLSRRKYDDRFPDAALAWALAASGVGDLSRVDLVVYDLLNRAGPRVLAALAERGYRGPVRACRHHDAHAASAFFASPFEEAAVLVLDAGGSSEGESGPGVARTRWPERLHPFPELQTQYRGRGSDLHVIRRTVAGPPNGINPGILYGIASVHLGFGPMGAGRVMGLAPFGEMPVGLPEPLFASYDGDPLLACPEWPIDLALLPTFYTALFGGVAPRASDTPLGPEHAGVAAYVQRQTSDAVIGLARHLAAVTGTRQLCFAGGYALNVVTNTRLIEETPFEALFVQPAATDGGVPLGCALFGAHAVLREPRRFAMRTVALGPSYGPAAIEAALRDVQGVSVVRGDDVPERAAAALADGRLVGWFSGRSELGPRALGQRSILGDPRTRQTVDRLNAEVKRREPFRPYAPVVLARAATTYFDLPVAESPFMLYAARVRPEARSLLPAITHVDGSARVQTVSPEEMPRFARLLEAFDAAAGVPVVLNTSFNGHGDPIVETPSDAVRMFLETGLDALALEDVFVEKAPGARMR